MTVARRRSLSVTFEIEALHGASASVGLHARVMISGALAG